MSLVSVLPVSANNLQTLVHLLLYNSMYLHIIARVFPHWTNCEGSEDSGDMRALSGTVQGPETEPALNKC